MKVQNIVSRLIFIRLQTAAAIPELQSTLKSIERVSKISLESNKYTLASLTIAFQLEKMQDLAKRHTALIMSTM